jgi:hypothetical protein
MADEINVSVTTVRNWRRNRARPHAGDAPLIEGALYGQDQSLSDLRTEMRESYRRAWSDESPSEAAVPSTEEITDEIARKTAEEFSAKLIAEFDARGFTRKAETAGLERQAIIALANRLRPNEIRSFEAALVELEYAVDVALNVLKKRQGGVNRRFVR